MSIDYHKLKKQLKQHHLYNLATGSVYLYSLHFELTGAETEPLDADMWLDQAGYSAGLAQVANLHSNASCQPEQSWVGRDWRFDSVHVMESTIKHVFDITPPPVVSFVTVRSPSTRFYVVHAYTQQKTLGVVFYTRYINEYVPPFVFTSNSIVWKPLPQANL